MFHLGNCDALIRDVRICASYVVLIQVNIATLRKIIQEGCLALEPTIATRKLAKKVSDRVLKI